MSLEETRAASKEPSRIQKSHLSMTNLSKVSQIKEESIVIQKVKKVSFDPDDKPVKKSPGKNTTKTGGNKVDIGIHTPCLRCDIAKDLDQLNGSTKDSVNEALKEVTEAKNSEVKINHDHLSQIMGCVDFCFNNLCFVHPDSEHFGCAFKNKNFMLESLRSNLTTYKAACLFPGTKPCQSFYID